MTPAGFEPATNALRGHCSTVELWGHGIYILTIYHRNLHNAIIKIVKNLVIFLGLIIVLIGGGFIFFSQNKEQPQSTNQSATSSDSAQTVPGYTGKALAN